MNAIVKLSSKNQITLPVALLRKLKAKSGTFFNVNITGNDLTLEKLPPLESFFGIGATKKNAHIDSVTAVREWRKNHDVKL